MDEVRDPLRAVDRQRVILEILERSPTVRVDELVRLLDVSRMTVHRDLAELTQRGDVQRIRGGIRRTVPPLSEDDVRMRRRMRTPVKKALAAQAAAFVRDGDVIILDDSSTVAELVPHLFAHRDLTIITHALEIMNAVAELRPRVSLIGLGGDYYPETDSFLGPGVARQLGELRADLAFVAVTAVRGGSLYHPDYEAAVTKRALLHAADRTVLLLDATRFDGRGHYGVAELAEIDDIVVDAAAGELRLAELRALSGSRIHPVAVAHPARDGS